jgi:hypothetical protein
MKTKAIAKLRSASLRWFQQIGDGFGRNDLEIRSKSFVICFYVVKLIAVVDHETK